MPRDNPNATKIARAASNACKGEDKTAPKGPDITVRNGILMHVKGGGKS